jgi:hypothetical protein
MLTVQIPFEISIYKKRWSVCYYCLTRVGCWLCPIFNIGYLQHSWIYHIIHMYPWYHSNQNLIFEPHSKNVIEHKNVSLYDKANCISCYNIPYLYRDNKFFWLEKCHYWFLRIVKDFSLLQYIWVILSPKESNWLQKWSDKKGTEQQRQTPFLESLRTYLLCKSHFRIAIKSTI